MYKPDQIDWQIIKLLNQDGRLSSAEISRHLDGLSPRKIKKRVDQLISEGVISIRSIVNPEKVGYPLLADIFIEVKPGKLTEVANRLSEIPEISYLVCATGDTDIIISLRSKSLEDLYDFVIEVIGKIPDVTDTRTFPLPYTIKNVVSWFPPEINEDK